MNKNEFLGYHSEWNLGSPGGWDYQRMAQEIGRFSWQKIKEKAPIDIELDFDDEILNPVFRFAQLLLRAHKKHFGRRKPFIALVSEEETLDKVGENIRFVEYLNNLPNITACLIPPHTLEHRDGKIYVGKDQVTVVFLDFNNNVIIKTKKTRDVSGLIEAIKLGIVVNPRGMEPVGAKGVFEAITLDYRDKVSKTTLERTPWTRMFYDRSTTGPDGKEITGLVEWTRDNWPNIVLKPVHGYSGKGIIIGRQETDIEGSIKHALGAGDYILQEFIPINLWAEEFPWLDDIGKKVFLKKWQTDFRSFVTDKGLMGFVTRFGGIPTNVGSGGGVQPTAILRSDIPVKEAINKINDHIVNLGYDFLVDLQNQIDNMSRQLGNVYLLGPIMSTLRPRIVAEGQLRELKIYAKHLWHDAIKLEKLWMAGRLSKHVQITAEEERIARLAPWQGRAALIASDGLFNFGGGV